MSLPDLGGKKGFVVGVANASCAVALIAAMIARHTLARTRP